MEHSKKHTVEPLTYDSYMAVVRNSPGTRMFRNLYATVDGERKDITKNGELSCAFFVSSVLLPFKLIKEMHATVTSTVVDLEAVGWSVTDNPSPGDVIEWDEADLGNSGPHKHIGFYIGNETAISNSHTEGAPVEHSWRLSDRDIVKILSYPYFNK